MVWSPRRSVLDLILIEASEFSTMHIGELEEHIACEITKEQDSTYEKDGSGSSMQEDVNHDFRVGHIPLLKGVTLDATNARII